MDDIDILRHRLKLIRNGRVQKEVEVVNHREDLRLAEDYLERYKQREEELEAEIAVLENN